MKNNKHFYNETDLDVDRGSQPGCVHLTENNQPWQKAPPGTSPASGWLSSSPSL